VVGSARHLELAERVASDARTRGLA
jgi:hypothetical protein